MEISLGLVRRILLYMLACTIVLQLRQISQRTLPPTEIISDQPSWKQSLAPPLYLNPFTKDEVMLNINDADLMHQQGQNVLVHEEIKQQTNEAKVKPMSEMFLEVCSSFPVLVDSLLVAGEKISYCHSRQAFFKRKQNLRSRKMPAVIIAMKSHPTHMAIRDTIRETWGRDESVVFIVAVGGYETDETSEDEFGLVSKALEAEIRRFGDLFLVDTEDTPDSRTNHALSLLNAVNKNYEELVQGGGSEAPSEGKLYANAGIPKPDGYFVMLSRDDAYVNLQKVKEIISEVRPEYFGYCVKDQLPNRDPDSDRYIPEEIYPDLAGPEGSRDPEPFPTFAHRVGYGVSNSFVQCILAQTSIDNDKSNCNGTNNGKQCSPFEAGRTIHTSIRFDDIAIGLMAQRCNVTCSNRADFWHQATNLAVQHEIHSEREMRWFHSLYSGWGINRGEPKEKVVQFLNRPNLRKNEQRGKEKEQSMGA